MGKPGQIIDNAGACRAGTVPAGPQGEASGVLRPCDGRLAVRTVRVMAMGKVQLRDGRYVLVRPASSADVPDIARLLAGLSPEAFRARFQGGQPTPGLVARLARLHPAGTVCVVASVPGEAAHLVAEARYAPISGHSGELAVTVADRYQRAGLGHLMLDALIETARNAGMERLRGIVSLTNGRMLRLLTRYAWTLAEPTDECSVASLEISAVGGMPGWPRDVTGDRILIERRSWFDDDRIAALREAGHEVRQCSGPDPRTGRECSLVATGQCRVADGADRIIHALPGSDRGCSAVLAAHRQRWPGKLDP